MNPRRFAVLLIAALLVISAGWYLNARRNAHSEAGGGAFLPSLAGELNSIASVAILKGNAAPVVTVHKSGTEWQVEQRGNYPADVTKLRTLLFALRDARIVEEKTADPARYAGIGVDDPLHPGAAGAELTLTSPAGARTLIVGNSVGQGNFVRRAGESQSYSVEPAITVETEPRFWIASRLFDLPAAQIERLEVAPAGGPGYSLERPKAGEPLRLERAPTGRGVLDPAALEPSPVAFGSFDVEDVAARAGIDFSNASRAVVTRADGAVLTLLGAVAGDKHWLQLSAVKDDALAARTKDRAFEISTTRYEAIFRPLEQLLVAKPAPGPAAPATSAPPATAAGKRAPPRGASSAQRP